MSRHPMTMPGAERIGPGIYAVGDAMHVVMEEVLAENGWPDNPHNRAMMERALNEWAHKERIPVKDLDREEPEH